MKRMWTCTHSMHRHKFLRGNGVGVGVGTLWETEMVVAIAELTVTLGWPGAGCEENVDMHTFHALTQVLTGHWY